MSIVQENAKNELEKFYSMIIKELKEEKNFYENEKIQLTNRIKGYQNSINEIDAKMEDIKNKENNYIENNKDNNLLPEYNHKIDILKNKKEFWENIVDNLNSKKDNQLQELDKNIEKCNKNIEKYNSDIERVKQAIYRNGIINIKLNEIIDLKELKKYAMQNENLLNYKK